MENDISTAIALLRAGQAPGNAKLLRTLSVGVDFLTDFWKEKYLSEYIREGGSKIKFITGGHGSGKTHLLQLLLLDAEQCGYHTVSFSAKNVWLHDFKEIYVKILESVDILKCLTLCSVKVIQEQGYSPENIPEGMGFVDYLSGEGHLDPIIKREIRTNLSNLFLKNPLIDNNFGLACNLLTGGILGYPPLEEHSRELLLQWLSGDKAASLPALRRLGLSPSRITRYNARHMLRSLIEVLKLSGYTGLTVAIDDMEMLISKDSLESIRYTKLKREDAYESIRELIDEIDTLKNVMFVFSFDRKLIDDELSGLKSYQALWMRIQNEITPRRFNRFTDIVDLELLAKQVYTPEVVGQMSARLTEVLNGENGHIQPINEETARELVSHAQFSGISLPLQMNIATMGGKTDD